MIERETEIPGPDEVKERLPVPAGVRALKARRDAEIRDVLSGRDKRLLLIVGPCSAHDFGAVLDYVGRLGRLSEKVRDSLVTVPRIYTSKPRTRGVGYKGMSTQPDMGKAEDIPAGIYTARRLHIEAAEASGLTAADEMLYPEEIRYLDDCLSYVAVGARSVEDQLHRFVSSGLDVPVGMKNPMGGCLPALVNSVYAAQSAQTFGFGGWQVRTRGNEYAHAVLRGRVDVDGRDVPNCDGGTIRRVAALCAETGLSNPAVIVDASHSNSGKDFTRQTDICLDVLRLMSRDELVRGTVKGFMVESFIEEGSDPSGSVYGKSVTDPCLGWAGTEDLVCRIAEEVRA